MRSKDENGFTLIELITVLLIIGLLAAIAAPNFRSWQPDMRLKAVARDLYSNMQKARMIAVKSNRNTAIVFDTASNKYEVCDDWVSAACVGGKQTIDFSSMKSGVGFGHGNATVQVPGGAFPGDNVSYSSPVNVAFFNSRGLGTAGYVYLDHQDSTTTYAVGSQSSGVIKLLKWQGSNWE